MKKCLRTLLLAVFALTASQLWADPPVCPPFEGFNIYTETDVDVSGNMSEEETFEWTWNNSDCSELNVSPWVTKGRGVQDLNDDELEFNESVARITYNEEFSSFNGLGGVTAGNENHSLRGDPISEDPTTYHKEFTVNTHPDGDYNLEVKKDIGYTSDGIAGHHADFKEVVSEEIVSAGGPYETGDLFDGVLALCPWAPAPSSGKWPAANMGVAMGSMFAIPYNLQAGEGPNGEIDFHSETYAGVTKGAFLNYDIQARGKGKVQAEMIARLWEGSTSMNPVTPGDTWLNSTATYTEKTIADGIIDNFHRGMAYKSTFALPGVTSIGLEILQ